MLSLEKCKFFSVLRGLHRRLLHGLQVASECGKEHKKNVNDWSLEISLFFILSPIILLIIPNIYDLNVDEKVL